MVKARRCRLVGSPCTQRCVGRLTRHLLPRILRAPLGSTGEGVLHVCSAREWNVAVMSITCGGDVSGAGISAVSASCHGLSCRASSIKQLSPGNRKRKKNITCYLSEKKCCADDGAELLSPGIVHHLCSCSTHLSNRDGESTRGLA